MAAALALRPDAQSTSTVVNLTTLQVDMSDSTDSVPNALAITDALNRSPTLASLRRRLVDSAQRHAAVLPCLAPSLAPHVTARPLDSDGWTLLAANASVAAKLRQLQPRLEQRLVECGFAAVPLRIKVRSG